VYCLKSEARKKKKKKEKKKKNPFGDHIPSQDPPSETDDHSSNLLSSV
jgi:hypothetical protein